MKKYVQIENFVVKMRAYPTKEQAEKIDKALHGIKVAYNSTAYAMVNGDLFVTKPDKKDETIRWPNFPACMKKEWLDWLRATYEAVTYVPSGALASSVYGIFVDLKKSWESTRLPVSKWKPDYYTHKKPRRSFTVQTGATAFVVSPDRKAVLIGVTGMGKIKCRGWRHELRYGQGDCTFEEFYGRKENRKKAFGVTVSKDSCGDYWIVVKLQTVWKPVKMNPSPVPLGIDVGVRDIAITSEGVKYENRHFSKEVKKKKRRLNRKVSRRQGWSSIEFRDAHKVDKSLLPSKGYEKAKLRLAKLDRKVARRRANHNDNITLDIVSDASFIGIESLNVKGMLKNKHLAYALSDAAMYSVLNKLEYKSKWKGIPIQPINQWKPSTKLCHVCGWKYKDIKLSVEEWTCPECGTHHDRDINAAKNILKFAQEEYTELQQNNNEQTMS